MKACFDLWDQRQDGNVATKDLGTLIRSLGYAPTEAEVKVGMQWRRRLRDE